jgi:hypothetical protein
MPYVHIVVIVTLTNDEKTRIAREFETAADSCEKGEV